MIQRGMPLVYISTYLMAINIVIIYFSTHNCTLSDRIRQAQANSKLELSYIIFVIVIISTKFSGCQNYSISNILNQVCIIYKFTLYLVSHSKYFWFIFKNTFSTIAYFLGFGILFLIFLASSQCLSNLLFLRI